MVSCEGVARVGIGHGNLWLRKGWKGEQPPGVLVGGGLHKVFLAAAVQGPSCPKCVMGGYCS